MAIKKSELYSSLWSSCDELRGGMDASQYKDYVLVLLFIKYVSDKYAGQPYAPITIPTGASFQDMVALKGKTDIGDQINKKIIGPLANANKLSDMPDFNDANKLGSGKEMVDRLTNLVAIFENKALDFSKNRAEGDDILGDAYEYLMRHFATESGKSKGQFYTPAEVSRIMAQIIGIRDAKTSAATTIYDPDLRLRFAAAQGRRRGRTTVTLYGQEKDTATSGLARMNMILHNNPTALIVQGNTLADPKFKDGDTLKTFDYIVANPPFSDKRWTTGLDPLNDPYERFKSLRHAARQEGRLRLLLHIVRSLKSTGKGACILPHGVLFRGNAEADIRRNLGPQGLHQRHHWPARKPLLRHRHPRLHRRDGQGRRPRPQGHLHDRRQPGLHQGRQQEPPARAGHPQDRRCLQQATGDPEFSRMVSVEEIEKNDFNLNLPRYIDSQSPKTSRTSKGTCGRHPRARR